MVNANELRLGNLLYGVSDRIETVKQITHTHTLKTHKAGLLMDGDLADYSPIPITEDWLLKIGLVQDESGRLFQPSKEIHEKCEGDIGFKCPSFFFNSRLNRWMDCQTRVCVDYIHQVQNLVYALTGEELSDENR